MSNYYAHLDSNDIVYCVTELSGIVSDSTLISITSYDTTLLGKQYDSATQTFNAVPLTLTQEQQLQIEELQTAFAESFSTFQSSTLGSVHTYPADAAAIQNLQYYVQLFAANPNKAGAYFKTIEDGIPIYHTKAQFFQLVDDFETFDVSRTTKLNYKEAQVNNSPDIPTVQSIVWNDTTPPATPTGLTATSPATGEITASWTKNTEIDVTYGGSYNIYLTDTTANTAATKTNVTTNLDTLTGLISGHVYNVAVSAVDSDGNESAQSTSVSVTVM